MKKLYRRLQGVLLCCLAQVCAFNAAKAQTLTAKSNVNIEPNCNGYYEYLPQNYNSSAKYPLLIGFHGAGEGGDGSYGDLQRLFNTGLPAMIRNGKMPNAFTLYGNTYQFIMVFPQFRTDPPDAPGELEAIYNFMVQHYPLDLNRVYLTGYSQGGGNIWKFTGGNAAVSKIAAIVPVAGSVTLTSQAAQNIAGANLPVLATHNSGDGIIPANFTTYNVNLINSSNPAPSPRAQDTIFNQDGHDSWDLTYDANQFNWQGLNMYQWMLQYQRNLAQALPVTLGSYTAQATGPSSVSVRWTTLSETNNRYFIVQRSADGSTFSALDTLPAAGRAGNYQYTDAQPLAGANFYRLAQVDLDGKATLFDVLKVSLAGPAPRDVRIGPNPAGSWLQVQLNHPATGTLWVLISDAMGRTARSWTFQKPATAWQQTLDLAGLTAGHYTIQLKGTGWSEAQQFVKQ